MKVTIRVSTEVQLLTKFYHINKTQSTNMFKLVKIINGNDDSWYQSLIGNNAFVLFALGDPWLWFGPMLRIHIKDVLMIDDSIEEEVTMFPSMDLGLA